MKNIHLSVQIPEELQGKRLDQALAALCPDYSRERLKQWILAGDAKVDGKMLKPRDKVAEGQMVVIETTLAESLSKPQNITLNIVYEDSDILVINKPMGLVVHPGAGNPDNTLMNALLHHEPNLATLPRAGIIHRLDKDTTGVMVIAKSLPAHTKLTQMMQQREIQRSYRAIVIGEIIAGGTVDAPIGRHTTSRTKMAVVNHGKPAVSHYRVLQKMPGFTYLAVTLESGRTHQIRVHMAHIKHPVLGDPLYGGQQRIATKRLNDAQSLAIKTLKRQALHAYELAFLHPITGEDMVFNAEIPGDFLELLQILKG